MEVQDILNPENWSDGKMERSISATTKKYLEIKATKIHTLIDNMNDTLVGEAFKVDTVLVGSKKDEYYTLHITIKHYGSKEEYEHKENTHRQEISI